MSVLDADRRGIVEIDAQISELLLEASESRQTENQATISDLRGSRAIAQERLDSYKYPVLELPPEIVSGIFIHFLPTYPDCPSPTDALSPTRLTQICHAWREISLATPSLWRAINLAAQDDFPPAKLAQELDIWVRRSGLCPMAVKFKFLPDDELSSKVLAAIAAQRTHLEHLLLHLDDALSLLPLSGPMPRLRHLDLDFEDDYSDSRVLVVPEAPLLRTVILTFTPARVALPWAQLTSLTLRYVFSRECSPVLEQTPHLTFCHLILLPGDVDSSRPITLRSLTSFKLDVLDLFPHYLHTFTVPSLRRLEITENFIGPDPLQSLASFISKSGCNLQELIMHKKHSISRSAYRETFPSINFSFLADGEEATGPES
ncbi:hypothetical protein C8R46DRAFT_1052603 [Mycena filopes]|nr:hypothetical protein C8R46DRAFT_1052603 [Mycena filopes]